MVNRTLSGAVLVVCVLALWLPALGYAVPPLLSYSGTLTDPSGNPVADGTYTVEFALYDLPTGGTALWTETWDGATVPVTTEAGAFSVLLGSHEPLPEALFAEHPETYLGVTVGADAEMVPRQRIASVAYAMRSADGVPPGGILMWSGAVDAVPDGWALCDGQERTLPDGSVVTPPDLRDRFILGAGGAYAAAATGGSATVDLSHSHTVDAHAHTFNAGSHTHSYSGQTSNPVGTKEDKAGGGGDSYDDHKHNFSGTTSAETVSGTTSSASGIGTDVGLTGSQPILPPYYALAFIMKL